MQAERELHIQVPFVRMLPQSALCPTAAIHYYLSYETNGRRSEASEDKGT